MLSAELKKIDEDLKALERAAMFMGATAQKSLLDVVVAPVLKEKPKGCHGACRNFRVLSGKGSCKRDEGSVDSMMSGCEHWERRSKTPPEETQSLVEAHRNYLKALIA